eukprot:CFRG3715T1
MYNLTTGSVRTRCISKSTTSRTYSSSVLRFTIGYSAIQRIPWCPLESLVCLGVIDRRFKTTGVPGSAVSKSTTIGTNIPCESHTLHSLSCQWPTLVNVLIDVRGRDVIRFSVERIVWRCIYALIQVNDLSSVRGQHVVSLLHELII